MAVTTTQGHRITQAVKSSTSYQGPVIGVVSDNYGDFTGVYPERSRRAGNNIRPEDNPMPVALVGRVAQPPPAVLVTNEGGAIAAGDGACTEARRVTTSSTAGKGMKANKAGRVIGMALEEWNGASGQAFPEPRRRVMVQACPEARRVNTFYEPGNFTLSGAERVTVLASKIPLPPCGGESERGVGTGMVNPGATR